MKKDLTVLFGSTLFLAGCASMQSGSKTEFINKTPKGEIRYVFPQKQCQDLYFDKPYSPIKVNFNYAQKEIDLVKEVRAKDGALEKSTGYKIPLIYRNMGKSCMVMTKYPYQKYTATDDPLAGFLFSSPEFTTDSLDYFLLQNARASYRLSIKSQYQPDSVYNNFVRAVGMDNWNRNGNRYTNINTYAGSGTLTVNSMDVEISISVSPYRNGSIAEISFNTPGFISGSQVDFSSQINAIEAKLKQIAAD